MLNLHERDTESSERWESLASFSPHLFSKVPFKDAKFYADLATLEVPHVFSVETPLFWSISYWRAHCTLYS